MNEVRKVWYSMSMSQHQLKKRSFRHKLSFVLYYLLGTDTSIIFEFLFLQISFRSLKASDETLRNQIK